LGVALSRLAAVGSLLQFWDTDMATGWGILHLHHGKRVGFEFASGHAGETGDVRDVADSEAAAGIGYNADAKGIDDGENANIGETAQRHVIPNGVCGVRDPSSIDPREISRSARNDVQIKSARKRERTAGKQGRHIVRFNLR
jgi:hypothetical protein